MCEAVAYFRGFRVEQDKLTINLNTWIGKINGGERVITQDHRKTILEPLGKMMHCLHAWNVALTTDITMVPTGGFTTLSAADLDSFWKKHGNARS